MNINTTLDVETFLNKFKECCKLLGFLFFESESFLKEKNISPEEVFLRLVQYGDIFHLKNEIFVNDFLIIDDEKGWAVRKLCIGNTQLCFFMSSERARAILALEIDINKANDVLWK